MVWQPSIAGSLDVRLDFERVDQEARQPQHVAHAAQEREAAVGLELGQIAGADIAVGGDRLGGRLLVAVVADHQRWPGAFERAGLANAQQFAGFRIAHADVGEG